MNATRWRSSVPRGSLTQTFLEAHLVEWKTLGEVDRTGLTGNWDFEMTFTPEPGQSPPGQAPTVDANAPSLFTALEEQLGLRLRAARGPVEMLVIDRVDRPTEN